MWLIPFSLKHLLLTCCWWKWIYSYSSPHCQFSKNQCSLKLAVSHHYHPRYWSITWVQIEWHLFTLIKKIASQAHIWQTTETQRYGTSYREGQELRGRENKKLNSLKVKLFLHEELKWTFKSITDKLTISVSNIRITFELNIRHLISLRLRL